MNLICIFFCFFVVSILFLSLGRTQSNVVFEIEDREADGIPSLMADNFKSFVNDEECYTFLVVYAPWCHLSKLLLLDLKKISSLLENDKQVKIAKVNAAINEEITVLLNVYRYPSLFMIQKDIIHRYTYGRNIKDIVLWVYANLNDKSVYEMKNIYKLENYIEHEEYNNSIVFFVDRNGENETLVQSLNDMCLDVAVSFCFYIREKEVINHLENVIMPRKNFALSFDKPDKHVYTVIYKNNNFDDYFHMSEESINVVYDTSLSYEERIQKLREFILENTEPLVIQFSELYFRYLFTADIPTLFIIYNDKHDLNKNAIIKSAKKYKSQIIFSICGSHEVFEKRLLSELIINKVDNPLMRIIEFQDRVDIPFKYKPIDETIEINEQSIDDFIKGYKTGSIYFYRKSERALPDEINNGYVKIIVADNYDENIFKNDKHIVVLYYASWCGHCRKFEPIYRELGKRLNIYSMKFKEYNNDIVISKIDAVNNEIYNISIHEYPSLYLYLKSNKKEPIKYTGARSVQDIISWITEKTNTNLDVEQLLNLSLDEEQLFENYEEL